MVYILSVSDLSKSYKGESILKDIEMEINSGEIVGLLGKNGSGKTTLLSMLVGMTKKDSGKITIASYEVEDSKNYMNYVRILQSSPYFYEELTGMQNLSIFCPDEYKENFLAIYEKLENVMTLKKKFKTFSLGMKRKFSIALVFCTEKPLLLLDEPLNGLDQESIIVFEELMMKHKKKGGSAIITTHQRAYMDSYCDYFLKIENHSLIKHTQLNDFGSFFHIKTKNLLNNVEIPVSPEVRILKTTSYSLQVEGDAQSVSLFVKSLIDKEIFIIELKEETIRKEVG